MKIRLLAFFLFFSCFYSFSQENNALKCISFFDESIANRYRTEQTQWIQYFNKTNLLLETIDISSYLNFVILKLDGNINDAPYFMEFHKREFIDDMQNLVYKVGKDEIDEKNISRYFVDLQKKWLSQYPEFQKNRNEIIAQYNFTRGPSNPSLQPRNCGSVCTNPGFESGNTFWDYFSGTADITPDPSNLIPGFNAQHFVTTIGTNDPVVGAALPQVPPGSGSHTLMLGNGPISGYGAARASISFDVTATSSIFTYKYAVVLQDPVSGHTDPERPYFRVKIRDAGGNVVQCGNYEVIAKPPISGFISLPNNIYYRPWTTISVALQSYIGQCVTVEFTSSDCSQGGHYGYAYIDAACDALDIIASSPVVCSGTNITLSAPAGAAHYVWTNTAGGTAGIVGSDTNQTISVNQPGTYQVIMTSFAGPTCTTTLNITIAPNTTPPIAAFTATSPCEGTSVQFTDTSTANVPAPDWYWDFNNDGINDSISQNPSYTYPSAGTYPVMLVIAAAGCSDTIIQNVTVIPIIKPLITSAGPFCENDSPALLTSSMIGGVWSGTGITNTTTGAFDPMIAGVGSHDIIYTITTPCPSADTITIVVNQLASADAGVGQTICAGSSVTLAGSVGGSATTGTWGGGNGTYTPNNNTLNAIYTPSASEIAAGSVTLTLISNDPSGPCPVATSTVIITVNPSAVIDAGPDQSICVAGTVQLAAIIGGAATSGTWTGGAGSFNPTNTDPNAIYTPTAAEQTAGTIILNYTSDDPAGPCIAVSDQMTVLIRQVPTANAGIAQSICPGATFTLAGSIGGSASSGNWTGGSGTFSPNTTTLNAVYTPSAADIALGSITLTLSTDDPVGPCNPVSSTVIISFHPLPVVNFLADVPKGCPIHCVNFSDLSTVAGPSTIDAWSWNFGDSQTDSVQTPNHCYNATGFYNVSLTATTNNGCSATLTIPQMIEVYTVPIADFTVAPNPVSTLNPSVTMTNESSNDVIYWDWDFGDGTIYSDNITPAPSHLYSTPPSTSYVIGLIVQNANGCKDTTTRPLSIAPEFTFFIPNAFSPNADGINDNFNGYGIGIAEYDIWIFDRWGNMIFHTNRIQPNDAWDGRANYGNEIAQQDVYVWKVKLKDVFGKTHKYMGTVTLVK